MKKFLLIVICLVLLALLGLGIFVATFDADRYRPLLVSEMQRALGRPVTLERIALGWRGGIAIQLKQLTIAESASVTEPLIQVESASALVHLLPLLRKRIEVASVVLQRPAIRIARDAQGQINLQGVAAAAAPAAAQGQRAPVGDGQSLTFNVDSLKIEDGTLHWTDALTTPATEMWVRSLDVSVRHIALGQPMDIEATCALASLSQNIHFTGRFLPPDTVQPGSLEQVQLAVNQLALEQVLPPARPDEPQMRGKFTTALQGRVPTLDPSQLAHALSGTGRIQLTGLVLTNFNLLREVFGRLSIIPGLVQTLEARLPTEYQQKLAAQDTAFAPIDWSVQVEEGSLRCEEAQLGTDDFHLTVDGRIGLEGTLNLRAMLLVEPTLSAAIIKSVSELQGLTTRQGELAIPLVIQGNMSRLAVLPDLRYVASKLVIGKAVDLLGRFLERSLPESSSQ